MPEPICTWSRAAPATRSLIFHDEIAHPGALKFHEALAQDYTVYIPSHPGFGRTPRLDWVMNMRDLAGWYLMALDELNLGPVNAIGCSLGGWLAAEIATMHPGQFKKLAWSAQWVCSPRTVTSTICSWR